MTYAAWIRPVLYAGSNCQETDAFRTIRHFCRLHSSCSFDICVTLKPAFGIVGGLAAKQTVACCSPKLLVPAAKNDLSCFATGQDL